MLDYEADEVEFDVSDSIYCSDSRSQFLVRPSSEDTGQDFRLVPTRGTFRCEIPRLPLVPGRYRITPRVTVNALEADYVEGAAFLTVQGGDYFGSGRLNEHSPVLVDHTWSLTHCGLDDRQ